MPPPTPTRGRYACSAPRAGRRAAGAADRRTRVVRVAGVRSSAPSGPAASPARSRRCCPGPARRASTGDDLDRLGESTGCRSTWPPAQFLEQYLTVLDRQARVDYSDLIRRAVLEADAAPRRAACALRPRLRRRVPGHRPQPGRACSARSPATARDLVVVGDPHQSIYAFRGADVRGILEFPDQFRRARRRTGPCRGPGTHPAVRAAAPRRVPADRRAARAAAGPSRPRPARRSSTPVATPAVRDGGSTCSRSTPSAPRPSTWPTCCGGRTSRTAWPGPTWPSWCARAAVDPRLRRALGGGRGPGRGRGRRGADGARAGGAAARRARSGGAAPRRGRRRPRRLRRPVRASGCSPRPWAASTPPTCGCSAARFALARSATPLGRNGPAQLARAAARHVVATRRRTTGSTTTRGPSALALAGLLRRAPGRRRRRDGRGDPLGRSGPRTGWPDRLRGARPSAAARPRAPRTVTSTPSARCSTRRPGPRSSRGHTGARRLPRDAGRAADPGRHARRAGRPRRRGAPADRPPGQGARVAAGRRRPRPGGRLARPPSTGHAPPGRPDRHPTAVEPPPRRERC